jgi:hypothetical protein
MGRRPRRPRRERGSGKRWRGAPERPSLLVILVVAILLVFFLIRRIGAESLTVVLP